jgi:hypothetical protein
MLPVRVSLRARTRAEEARDRQRRRMTLIVLFWGALAFAVIMAGSAWATPAAGTGAAGASSRATAATASRPKGGVRKTHKVVHSPYALAAASHSAAPAPGTPIKGHSTTMVQGLGTSGLRKRAVGRPR